MTRWKQEAVSELPVVFEHKDTQAQAQEVQEKKDRPALRTDRQTHHADELAEKDYPKKLVSNLTPDERLALIERDDSSSPSQRVVSLLWQSNLLSIT